MSGRDHSCAVDDVGSVTCWGYNHYGQTTVPNALGGVVQVAAGSAHTCAVDDAGVLRCWGGNLSSQASGFNP